MHQSQRQSLVSPRQDVQRGKLRSDCELPQGQARPFSRQLSFEPLEARRLLDGSPNLSPQLLRDLASGDSSSSGQFADLNGTTFFAATDGTKSGLWKTDGTAGGTEFIVGLTVQNLMNLNGTLFFSGNDGTHGSELWRSDGTAAGTTMVANIRTIGVDGQPADFGSDPSRLTNVAGMLFFTADDGIHGRELWRSDGTGTGTILLGDIFSGRSSANPKQMTTVGNLLFFNAGDGSRGTELWKSDGTVAGTTLVKDIYPGSVSSYPYALTNLNGSVFFRAEEPSGQRLWRSDGTAEGTVIIRDGGASYLRNVSGLLFFRGSDSVTGTELWKSDGTPSGTVLVADIAAGTANSSPAALTNVNGTLFFRRDDSAHNNELWKSDGTSVGTVYVGTIPPPGSSAIASSFVAVGDSLFFQANDGAHGLELWKSDGTSDGTGMLSDIRPGVYGSNPGGLTNVNGTLFFAANDGVHGFEPWSSNGTATAMLCDLNSHTKTPSNPQEFTQVGDTTFFVADYSTDFGPPGYALWLTDGTPDGTRMVTPIVPRLPNPSRSHNLTNVNGMLFFARNDGSHGYEIWKSDGTTEGTVLVKDVRPGGAGSGPTYLTNLNGNLIFAANDGASGNELWRSDGTESGTVLVSNIRPAVDSSSPAELTVAGEKVFFLADDGTHGRELWRTDGTTAGTALVKDVVSGGGSSILYSGHLTNVSGVLFFSAKSNFNRLQLWKSDGTESGTVLVKTINPIGDSFRYSSELVNVNGTLLFMANDGTHGYELWKSDGTASGTVMVADISPGGPNYHSYPKQLINVKGTLFFTATESHGRELWTSDGTAAGTALVADIRSGSSSSSIVSLTNVNGQLFFSANDGTHGPELWVTDGTALGTTIVADIRPGSSGSAVGALVNSGGTLYFRADDNIVGSEPWILRVPAVIRNRQLFYRGSHRWDVTSANLPSYSDDSAIAPDKTAYLPDGSPSVFANVSSYINGINGLMLDIDGRHGTITANDFIFKIGNNNTPDTWTTAPAPVLVTVRDGAGTGGSDRIDLIWDDHAVQNTWLQVVVRGNDSLGSFNLNTGLAASDVSFWGSAPGDSGAGNAGAFAVTSADEISARTNPRGLANQATITDVNDFNRDGLVNSTDQIIARNNTTSLGNQLKFLVVGAGGPFTPESSSFGNADIAGSSPSQSNLGEVPLHLVASAERSVVGGDTGIASALASATSVVLTSSVPPLPLIPRANSSDKARATEAYFQQLAAEKEPLHVDGAAAAVAESPDEQELDDPLDGLLVDLVVG
jgi:ELWxxDGT repeat protein